MLSDTVGGFLGNHLLHWPARWIMEGATHRSPGWTGRAERKANG